MAALESYEEKIFRLAFKMSENVPHLKSDAQLRDNVDAALKLSYQVAIKPYLKALVLQEIRNKVIANGLQDNKGFNERLDELDARNPKDNMAEEIERLSGYSKQVTRQMIQIADGLLNATVEVSDLGESSEEEDINEVKDNEEIDAILKFIIETPLDKKRKKKPVSEDTRNKLRREILEAMLNPKDTYFNLNSGEFLSRLQRFSASKGGTKRRKPKRRQKTKKEKKNIKT